MNIYTKFSTGRLTLLNINSKFSMLPKSKPKMCGAEIVSGLVAKVKLPKMTNISDLKPAQKVLMDSTTPTIVVEEIER